jgi:uncharacterized protein YggU (UPF0235/DUF167 family)
MYVKVRVKTGARTESLQAVAPDRFVLAVKEKPERNLANRRVVALIAAHFHVAENRVRIVNGHHAPSKLLLIQQSGRG